jgi:hypothetical protein
MTHVLHISALVCSILVVILAAAQHNWLAASWAGIASLWCLSDYLRSLE